MWTVKLLRLVGLTIFWYTLYKYNTEHGFVDILALSLLIHVWFTWWWQEAVQFPPHTVTAVVGVGPQPHPTHQRSSREQNSPKAPEQCADAINVIRSSAAYLVLSKQYERKYTCTFYANCYSYRAYATNIRTRNVI